MTDDKEASSARVMATLSIIALVSIALGISSYILNVEQNRCEMTYMYEVPEYIPVPLTAGGEETAGNEHHTRYRLFVYGEGIYAQQLQNELKYNKMTGVPVLFIPGAGGSHAQARSLASVLMRKGDTLRSNVQFNVFTVDFGADFSALDGALLAKQSDFVVRCLRRIAHLYPQRTSDGKGASVIVYGHSMGGIVSLMAAKAVSVKGREDAMAPLVMTFATPFRPVVYVDPLLEQTYNELFEDLPENLFILSVGGGFRDHLVPSHLTVTNMSNPLKALDANTMTMPLAWASTDHKCIVWCRQVVLATARVLYELVDGSSKRMTKDLAVISSTVRKHFVASDHLPYVPDFITGFDSSVYTNPTYLAAGSVQHETVSATSSKGHSLKVSLSNGPKTHFAVLHNWPGDVELLNGQTSISAESSLLLPPLYSRKRLTIFKSENLPSETELSFKPTTVKGSPKLSFTTEALAASSSALFQVNFPTMGAAFKSFFAPTLIASGVKNRLIAQVLLNGFDSPYNGATFRAVPSQCSGKSNSHINGTVVVFHNADNVDEAYEYAPVGQPVTMTIRKQYAAPYSNASLPRITLILDPSCSYDFEIKWSLPDVSAQYIRFVGHMFPTTLGLVLISFVMATVRTIDDPIKGNLMLYVFFQCKPVSIVAMSKLLHMVASRFAHMLPVPFDFDVISNEGDNVMFGALPVLLYFFVLGFFGVYSQILSLVFCLVGRPFARISSFILKPSLYLALFLQIAGMASASVFSSALAIGLVYLSFMIPLLCFSSIGKNWQLQRHVFSLALFSLWFTLVAGPTFLHQFFLPASNGFDPKRYHPILAGADGSPRFDMWLVPGAMGLAAGAFMFTLAIIRRLGLPPPVEVTPKPAAPATPGQEKPESSASRLLQFGAIGMCLFASRTLHRAPTIAGVAFAAAGLVHLFKTLTALSDCKSKPAERPKKD